jgi:protein-tyrosine phosphatase
LFTILVVCTANVCRSPLAAFTLRQHLVGGDGGQDFAVVSAGTLARTGQAICPRAASSTAPHDDGVRYAEQHASQRVSEELVEAADLILAADAENRTRIALVSPLARRRTFTLREADAILARMESGSVPLSGLVPAMHSRRADAVSEAPARRWFGLRSHDEGGPDILDGHNISARQHQRTLEEVQSVAASLAARLSRAASVQAS